MSAILIDETSSGNYFTLGALVSVLLHALLVALAIFVFDIAGSDSSKALEPVLMVSFEPPPPPTQQKSLSRQMVSPSEKSLDSAPPPDAFLSERDASVAKQQIRRGDAEDAGPAPIAPGSSGAPASQAQPQRSPQRAENSQQRASSNRSAPAESAAKSPREKSSSKLPKLALDEATLFEKFSAPSQVSSEDKLKAALSGDLSTNPTSSLASVQPFSRLSGSGARIFGARGSSDFLPTLPDGDITLLNTKANLFAVFVRRVAIQVFSNLRSSGWERLSAADVRAIAKDTTVRAVLSKSGTLLSVTLEAPSGSQRFDEVLSLAVKQGARDPNPPAAAALADGNIHLIFKARSWVQFGSDPRSGAPGERRWLVLGTGLE